MFDHGFPSDWSTLKKLIWLKGAGIIGAENLPDGYTKLNYLSNPNGAYIDTGIVFKNGYKTTIEFEAAYQSGVSSTQFGWRRDGTYTGNAQCYTNTNGQTCGVFCGTSASDLTRRDFAQDTKVTVALDSAIGKIFVNGNEATFPYSFDNNKAFDSNGSSVYNPFLFAINNKGSAAAIAKNTKIYEYKVEQGNALVQNMIPCIDPNNVYGMYDTVSKTFFGSANGKSFMGA